MCWLANARTTGCPPLIIIPSSHLALRMNLQFFFLSYSSYSSYLLHTHIHLNGTMYSVLYHCGLWWWCSLRGLRWCRRCVQVCSLCTYFAFYQWRRGALDISIRTQCQLDTCGKKFAFDKQLLEIHLNVIYVFCKNLFCTVWNNCCLFIQWEKWILL